MPAPFFADGIAHHAEEPGLEGCLPIEVGTPFEYLQVGRLQDILGVRGIVPAATQRPPETQGVKVGQLGPQLGSVH